MIISDLSILDKKNKNFLALAAIFDYVGIFEVF